MYAPVPGYTFFGGGVKTSLRIVAVVCVFGPGSWRIFSYIWTPQPMAGVPGPNFGYPQSPPPPPPHMANEDLAVFTLGGLFSGT